MKPDLYIQDIWVRLCGDKLYELIVAPFSGPPLIVLPYAFPSKDNARAWLRTVKARETIAYACGEQSQGQNICIGDAEPLFAGHEEQIVA